MAESMCDEAFPLVVIEEDTVPVPAARMELHLEACGPTAAQRSTRTLEPEALDALAQFSRKSTRDIALMEGRLKER